jgi:hypothetical protein
LLFVGAPQATISNSQINLEVFKLGSFCEKAYSPYLGGGNVQTATAWAASFSQKVVIYNGYHISGRTCDKKNSITGVSSDSKPVISPTYL